MFKTREWYISYDILLSLNEGVRFMHLQKLKVCKLIQLASLKLIRIPTKFMGVYEKKFYATRVRQIFYTRDIYCVSHQYVFKNITIPINNN